MSEAASSRLGVAFYGDDFTGSVDVLLQFARHGRTGRLFVGLPDADQLRVAADEHDVVGIAGIARSLPTDRIEAEVRPAFEALAGITPRLVQYKACSTADSSPKIGSIGRVLEVAQKVIGAHPVPMLFAQPDFGRYTIFGHHFAVEDGTVHRLDRQPTMSAHPSTPMSESDLARHLSAQTELPIGAISRLDYDMLGERLTTATDAAIVLDALDDRDLEAVGRAVLSSPTPLFAIGSGGLSWGLGAASPGAAASIPVSSPARGPVLAVSGSRSARSRHQVEHAAASGWLVTPLDFSDTTAQTGIVQEALSTGRSVVLTSDGAPGGADTLERIAVAGAAVIRASTDLARRIIVAGGDTSGRITRLLGVTSLAIVANPVGNVVLLRASSPSPGVDGLELLLKGGQVGADDLFESIRTLGG